MNKKGRKQAVTTRCFMFGAAVLLLVLIVFGVMLAFSSCKNIENDETAAPSEAITLAQTTAEAQADTTNASETQKGSAASFVVYPERTKETVKFSDEFDAQNALLICCDDNKIIAGRKENEKMYPASLTKVMTLIVAVENCKDLSETVTITEDMVDPMLELDASMAGFQPGDTFALEDVLYGMILNSGADAALAAAKHIAGSEEAFVELMNRKTTELGLKNTHFTNVVGLHHKENYSTAEDMALILQYAIKDARCRQFLEKVEYTTHTTEVHPEGLTFASTLFSRMYGDEMPGVKIRGGKTGYTDEAGNCIESYAEINKKTYILVLCGAKTNWNNIYDTLSAYSIYCAGGSKYEPPQP